MIISPVAIAPSTEIYAGNLLSAAFTNTTYTLTLAPGFWRVALFINGNNVSAGTMTAAVTLPDGTAGESDAPEALAFNNGTSVNSGSLSLVDFIGVTQLNITGNPGTNVGNNGLALGIPVFSSIVFTVA